MVFSQSGGLLHPQPVSRPVVTREARWYLILCPGEDGRKGLWGLVIRRWLKGSGTSELFPSVQMKEESGHRQGCPLPSRKAWTPTWPGAWGLP